MKKNFKDWKNTILILLGIIALGFLLRFLRIIIFQQPVFADEAIYIRWAQIMRAEPTLRFLPLSDGKQPLFMWAVIPFLKIFSDPLFAGRFVSVVCSLVTIIGIFSLTYLLFKSSKSALIACLIYAISPFSVFFDSMALVDSMLMMFGVWIFIFGFLTVRTLRSDFAMLTGFTLGGASLTKSPWIFFAMLLPTLTLFVKLPKEKSGRIITLLKLISLFLITYFLSLAIYNILRLGPNFHMIGLRNQDYVFPLSHLWQNPKDPFIFHIRDIINWFWLLGPGVLMFLIILGFLVGVKNYKKEITILSLWLSFPLLVNSMYAKVFTARYILFITPFIFIIASLPILIKKKELLIRLLFILFVIQAMLVNFLIIFDIGASPLPKNERAGYLEEWTAGYGIREVADYLIYYHQQNPNEKIVVGTEGFFGTLPDGLQMYLSQFPEITVIGVGLDIKELPQSLVESKEAGNKSFLVINSSRLVAKPEEIGLTLVGVYPKPLRTPGTHDYARYGPQETLYFFEVTDTEVGEKKQS